MAVKHLIRITGTLIMISKIKKKLRFLIEKKVCLFFCFTIINVSFTPVFACDAPIEKFCVDFYKGRNLEGKALLTRETPTINYNWEMRRPARNVRRNNFSARWRGRFNFAKGLYKFRVHADEGVRLLIDGQLIIDHWKDGQGIEYFEKVTPGSGIHLVEVEYYETTGVARIEVDWESLSLEKRITKPMSKKRMTPLFYKRVRKRNEKSPPIGVNLSRFNYWSSSVPFKDLLIQSGSVKILKKGSNEVCSQQPTLNDEGFPGFLPKGCVIKIWSVFHIPDDDFWPVDTPAYKPGRYVLLYQGKGKIKLGWDAKNSAAKGEGRIEFDVPSPQNGIQVEVISMDLNDAIRDIHIVHINDELTFDEQPFNETWLGLLKPFRVIRFMDWGKISENKSVYYGKAVSHSLLSITLPASAPIENGIFENMMALVNVDEKWPRVFIDRYDGSTRTLYLKTPIKISETDKPVTVNIFEFVNRTWNDRATETTFGQSSIKGVSFESMIKLANTLHINPWINIPTAADDDFVENLALLIKNELNPGLKCYIEYSNETWNYGFPGYHYSEAMTRYLDLKGTVIPADAWHSYRAIEIFKIFNKVFGESDLQELRAKSRLIRVLASQTDWLDRAEAVMDWKMSNNAWPTQGEPAYKYADAWAVTAYFSIKDNKNVLKNLSMDEVFNMQIESISDRFGTAKNPGILRKLLSRASNRNLQLVAYEGGTHLLAPANKTNMVDKVANINKDQRMKNVYLHLLNQWDLLYQEFGANKVGVLNQYNDISRYSKYGFWGLLQSSYQDPETAPKYKAIREWEIK